jgi:hypothetical protein
MYCMLDKEMKSAQRRKLQQLLLQKLSLVIDFCPFFTLICKLFLLSRSADKLYSKKGYGAQVAEAA